MLVHTITHCIVGDFRARRRNVQKRDSLSPERRIRCKPRRWRFPVSAVNSAAVRGIQASPPLSLATPFVSFSEQQSDFCIDSSYHHTICPIVRRKFNGGTARLIAEVDTPVTHNNAPSMLFQEAPLALGRPTLSPSPHESIAKSILIPLYHMHLSENELAHQTTQSPPIGQDRPTQ